MDEDIKNKTFIFSLDNKKIYYLKSQDSMAVFQDEGYGPCFGYLDDIVIKGNPIKEQCLRTNPFSFDYKGDEQALSESNNNLIKALDYEVFQIIFHHY